MKKISEILGIEFPVFQGGMANIADGAFAAAVSEAGALGIIGAGGMNAEKLERGNPDLQVSDRKTPWCEYYADESGSGSDGGDCDRGKGEGCNHRSGKSGKIYGTV